MIDLIAKSFEVTIEEFLRQIVTKSTGTIGLMRIVNLEEPLKKNGRYLNDVFYNAATSASSGLGGYINSLEQVCFLTLNEGTNIVPSFEKIMESQNTQSGFVNFHWGSKNNHISIKETTGFLLSKSPAMQTLKILSTNSLERFLLQNGVYRDLNGQIIYAGLIRLVLGKFSTLAVDLFTDKNYKINESIKELSFNSFLQGFLDLNNYFVPEIEYYGYVNGFNKTVERGYSITFDFDFMIKHSIFHKTDITNLSRII